MRTLLHHFQRVALLDKLRENPRQALVQLFPARGGAGPHTRLPVRVRALGALFLPSRVAPSGRFFRKAALKILKVD
jgi:hypothetical protein